MDHPENSSEYAGLQVNSGVKQPPIVNPYLKRNRRRELSAAELVEGIVKGDVTILSQAVTLIESVNPDHQARAQEVINKCLPYSGRSIRVGISGVPGAGKSTSIDEFGMHVLREKGGKLAVLAMSVPKALSSEIRPVWKSWRSILTRSYVLVHRQVLWVVWPERRVRRLSSVRLLVSTRYLSRPWVSDRVRRPVTRWSTSSC